MFSFLSSLHHSAPHHLILSLSSSLDSTASIVGRMATVISLYSIVRMSSLHEQLSEVQTLQNKMTKYYQLYKDRLLADMQDNQFLPTLPQPTQATDHHSQNIQFSSQQVSVANPAPHQVERVCSPAEMFPISESHIVESHPHESEEANLSQIFDSIVLGDEVGSNSSNGLAFDVELQYGEMGICEIGLGIGVHHRDEYSLSNFSSFSHHQDTEVEFSQLIEGVQRQVGRTLNQAGISKIISQIEYQVQAMRPFQDSFHPSQAIDSNPSNYGHNSNQTSFLTTLTEEQKLHRYDDALNRHAFHRAKQPTVREEDSSLNWIQSERLASTTAKRVPMGKGKAREEKENRRGASSCRTGVQKEVKVARRGRELLLVYVDFKQIDQFCTINKIFGREKDRLMLAVKSGKSQVSLE